MAFHEKKKKLKFLRHEKDSYVTKLIYKSLPICSSFFRVLVKEITAVKKKNNDFDIWQRRILYADFLNEPSYAFMPQAQTDRNIEGSNNLTLTAMNRYHISILN